MPFYKDRGELDKTIKTTFPLPPPPSAPPRPPLLCLPVSLWFCPLVTFLSAGHTQATITHLSSHVSQDMVDGNHGAPPAVLETAARYRTLRGQDACVVADLDKEKKNRDGTPSKTYIRSESKKSRRLF